MEINYKREHKIDFTCIGDADNSFARIDFLLIQHGFTIFLEVDEEQHKFGYGKASCDMKRMAKIIESLRLEGNKMKFIFIRYNPNSFSINYKKQRVLKKDKEHTLITILQDKNHYIFNSDKDVIIQYMYYDTVNDYADVTYDSEYNQLMRECCLPTIL
jgi:hypothetical protein